MNQIIFKIDDFVLLLIKIRAHINVPAQIILKA